MRALSLRRAARKVRLGWLSAEPLARLPSMFVPVARLVDDLDRRSRLGPSVGRADDTGLAAGSGFEVGPGGTLAARTVSVRSLTPHVLVSGSSWGGPPRGGFAGPRRRYLPMLQRSHGSRGGRGAGALIVLVVGVPGRGFCLVLRRAGISTTSVLWPSPTR